MGTRNDVVWFDGILERGVGYFDEPKPLQVLFIHTMLECCVYGR